MEYTLRKEVALKGLKLAIQKTPKCALCEMRKLILALSAMKWPFAKSSTGYMECPITSGIA